MKSNSKECFSKVFFNSCWYFSSRSCHSVFGTVGFAGSVVMVTVGLSTFLRGGGSKFKSIFRSLLSSGALDGGDRLTTSSLTFAAAVTDSDGVVSSVGADSNKSLMVA